MQEDHTPARLRGTESSPLPSGPWTLRIPSQHGCLMKGPSPHSAQAPTRDSSGTGRPKGQGRAGTRPDCATGEVNVPQPLYCCPAPQLSPPCSVNTSSAGTVSPSFTCSSGPSLSQHTLVKHLLGVRHAARPQEAGFINRGLIGAPERRGDTHIEIQGLFTATGLPRRWVPVKKNIL